MSSSWPLLFVFLLFFCLFNLWQHRTDCDPLMHVCSVELPCHPPFSRATPPKLSWKGIFQVRAEYPTRRPLHEVLGWPTGGRLDTAYWSFRSPCTQPPSCSAPMLLVCRNSMPAGLPDRSWPGGPSWQGEATMVPLRIGVWPSVGKRARGHTVGPEPSRMSPQSGFQG